MLPFNKPSMIGRELDYVAQAVNGAHTSAKGPFSARAVEELRAAHDAADVLLTTSCTDALELSALLLDLGPDDTVIVPSYTFVTTALAFARTGARLLFADIEPRTLGLDPQHVAELLDPSVRAVVPVHYAGVGCDIAGLETVLLDRPDVAIVEDNAHGLFGAIDGKPLGTFGRLSTLSFHETKNFVCGEGGALVINNPTDVDRAHTVYDKGTDRRQFLLGQVDKYTWQDTGSSFGMSDMLAAYLCAQLERRDWVLSQRRRVFERYMTGLAPAAVELGFGVPTVPSSHTPAYHMFYLLLEDRQTRDRVLSELRVAGVQSAFHYVPLGDSPGAKAVLRHETRCPVTESISGRLLRLPFYNTLEDHDIDHVITEFLRIVS